VIDRVIVSLATDGPQTAEQLAERFAVPLARMRGVLADEVFRRAKIDGKVRPVGRITCDQDGRYLIGDPVPLLAVQR
jgi:hypothetical protein